MDDYSEIALSLNELNSEQLHIMTGWLLEANQRHHDIDNAEAKTKKNETADNGNT